MIDDHGCYWRLRDRYPLEIVFQDKKNRPINALHRTTVDKRRCVGTLRPKQTDGGCG